MGKLHIGQSPTAFHHPFLDVLAVDLAPRHLAAAAVGPDWMAGPGLVVGVMRKFVARSDAAGPALALGVEAKLIDRRRVDPAQPDSRGADLDQMALADLRHPG